MPYFGPPRTTDVRLTELLKLGVETQPEEVALISAETQWSWQELENDSNRYAANLFSLGLSKGDRIASLMPNRNALLLHYLGCIKAGMVATPLNYRYTAPEIDHALSVSGAAVLLVHAERSDDIAASKRVNDLPLGVLWYGKETPREKDFESILTREPTDWTLPEILPDDPLFIYFTSGSTGKPKGVTHTHLTMGNMVAASIEGMGLDKKDRLLPGSSISHIGGSLMSLSALACGAKVITARYFDADELLPLMHCHRPTVLVMLPAALIALVRDNHAQADAFKSLRLCMSGGDKVAQQLEDEFAQVAGFYIEEGYGMSEIGMCTMNPIGGKNKVGSVGVLFPGYEAEIRDEQGNEMSSGQEGRLWVRSPANTICYWNRPDATAETIQNSWLDTGDIMKVDEDEYFWFCGRKKQIIVHNGSNICPQEVEESLLTHPAVELAGVVGIHDIVHGENVRAYLTLDSSEPRPSSQDLIQCSRERVGYKAPEEIVILDEMPMNATGKVDRVTLKTMAESNAGPTT